jgi:hypothetical protein
MVSTVKVAHKMPLLGERVRSVDRALPSTTGASLSLTAARSEMSA